MMETTDFSLSRRELLEEMAHQAEVLDRVSRLLLEKSGNITTGDSEWTKTNCHARGNG